MSVTKFVSSDELKVVVAKQDDWQCISSNMSNLHFRCEARQ